MRCVLCALTCLCPRVISSSHERFMYTYHYSEQPPLCPPPSSRWPHPRKLPGPRPRKETPSATSCVPWVACSTRDPARSPGGGALVFCVALWACMGLAPPSGHHHRHHQPPPLLPALFFFAPWGACGRSGAALTTLTITTTTTTIRAGISVRARAHARAPRLACAPCLALGGGGG